MGSEYLIYRRPARDLQWLGVQVHPVAYIFDWLGAAKRSGIVGSGRCLRRRSCPDTHPDRNSNTNAHGTTKGHSNSDGNAETYGHSNSKADSHSKTHGDPLRTAMFCALGCQYGL